MTSWGSPVELERKRRINLAIWAYAYEVLHTSIVDDATFDEECLKVDLSVSTGNKKLDNWFRENFTPDTGMWIYSHPELAKVVALTRWIIEDAK